MEKKDLKKETQAKPDISQYKKSLTNLEQD
jgi:hypothetical protein